MRYGKILENGELSISPSTIKLNDGGICINPNAETLLANGFYKLADNKPNAPANMQVKKVSFKIKNNKIYNVYEYEPMEPRNLSISKRKLMNNLKDIGKWETIKAALEQSKKWDDFVMSTTLDEQDPMMQEAIAGVKQLGVTDEQVEQLLINSQA